MGSDAETAGSDGMASGRRPQSADTAAETERVLFDYYRGLSPAAKVGIVKELCEAAETYALAGIRLRHPNAGSRELQMRLAATRLSAADMCNAFGWTEPPGGKQ